MELILMIAIGCFSFYLGRKSVKKPKNTRYEELYSDSVSKLMRAQKRT